MAKTLSAILIIRETGTRQDKRVINVSRVEGAGVDAPSRIEIIKVPGREGRCRWFCWREAFLLPKFFESCGAHTSSFRAPCTHITAQPHTTPRFRLSSKPILTPCHLLYLPKYILTYQHKHSSNLSPSTVVHTQPDTISTPPAQRWNRSRSRHSQIQTINPPHSGMGFRRKRWEENRKLRGRSLGSTRRVKRSVPDKEYVTGSTDPYAAKTGD